MDTIIFLQNNHAENGKGQHIVGNPLWGVSSDMLAYIGTKPTITSRLLTVVNQTDESNFSDSVYRSALIAVNQVLGQTSPS